jgi:hypothetical protein
VKLKNIAMLAVGGYLAYKILQKSGGVSGLGVKPYPKLMADKPNLNRPNTKLTYWGRMDRIRKERERRRQEQESALRVNPIYPVMTSDDINYDDIQCPDGFEQFTTSVWSGSKRICAPKCAVQRAEIHAYRGSPPMPAIRMRNQHTGECSWRVVGNDANDGGGGGE